MKPKVIITLLIQASLCWTCCTAAEYYTEEFYYDFDLNGISLTFTPDGSANYYGVSSSEAITELPYDVGSAPGIPLFDDDAYRKVLQQGVIFYGVAYFAMRVGSNGYITFNESDGDYTPTLTEHFSLPRISLYFHDLNPWQGGRVIVTELSDRVVVTYKDVPRFGNTSLLCNAQCELFYDAEMMRLSWVDTDNMGYTIVGLSEGSGYDPESYVESNLSAYYTSPGNPNDMDGDGLPDSWEAFHFGSYTNCAPYGHGDSDGYDNESEYIAGTDPTDPSSYFSMGYSRGSSQIMLNWNSLTGRIYSVQHCTSLTSPFTNVATGVVHPQNSYTSPIGSGPDNGFFKVNVQMTP